MIQKAQKKACSDCKYIAVLHKKLHSVTYLSRNCKEYEMVLSLNNYGYKQGEHIGLSR